MYTQRYSEASHGPVDRGDRRHVERRQVMLLQRACVLLRDLESRLHGSVPVDESQPIVPSDQASLRAMGDSLRADLRGRSVSVARLLPASGMRSELSRRVLDALGDGNGRGDVDMEGLIRALEETRGAIDGRDAVN